MINHVGIGPKILRNLLCLLKALPADKRNAEEAEKCGSISCVDIGMEGDDGEEIREVLY